MSLTKNKPHKGKAQTVKTRRHRLHVPPGSSTVFTPTSMSQAMVDRMFWRAGFGPSAADRAAWIGKPGTALVDWLLTPPHFYPAAAAPPTVSGQPIDPLASQNDLVIEWLYRMQTGINPLT